MTSRPPVTTTSDRKTAKGFLPRLARDTRGLSAVEFALLAPVLITMYFGIAEVGQAFMAQKRQAHVASMVADLVAQTDVVTVDGMEDVFAAGALVIKPFAATNLTVRVTSVTRDSKGVDRVVWSRGSGIAPRGTDSVVSGPAIPAGMIANGESLVMSETSYNYISPVKRFIPAPMVFKGAFFLLPRRVSVVGCSDCPRT